MGHHLVMGVLKDALTGAPLDDTHDERYRQGLVRLLLAEKGYDKADLASRRTLVVRADARSGKLAVDLLVELEDRLTMVVKYGPGSLVTRERPALAAGRLIAPYQVPIVVVTNGEDAHILDGANGKLLGRGLAAIPDRPSLLAVRHQAPFHPIEADRAERESRLLYCYEIDGACPCDDTVCQLPESGPETG
ncbi:MAG: type I restriction enzyme HsdR N-terminal domain-containing protein [Desulfosarcinaceae bacterium]|nr:type I restriction enzyme HsdR N-terminal domain-containing protein [Desulfosarcinaceae bacterium]